MGPLPETSLVITAHRHGPMLEKCLEATAALDPAPGETIVVADGNDQAVAGAAGRHGFETIVLPNAPGVSAARNAGAARAKGKFLLFLDSDVVPRRDHVAKAVSALETIPGAMAAFGCYDDSPAAPGVVSRYRNLLHHYTHFHANRDAQSFWAACGICDAGVFREAGGFDENYRVPSIEDIALGYKIRRAGHRIALDPSWQVKHLKQWAWRDLVVTDIARRAIPWTILLLREGRLDNDLNIDTRSRWSAFLVAAALAFLPISILLPWLLAGSAACFTAAIFLNRRFYRFLANRGGRSFAIRAVPLHLFYYLASVVGFAVGWLAFGLWLRQSKSSAAATGAVSANNSGGAFSEMIPAGRKTETKKLP